MSSGTKNILIIEDDPDTQDVLADVFMSLYFTIAQAYTGDEGISMCEWFSPDLIILDVHMPDIDGLSILKRLYKRHVDMRKVPVIVLSNMRLKEQEIRDFIGNQNVKYLHKIDTTLERLVNVSESLLDSRIHV